MNRSRNRAVPRSSLSDRDLEIVSGVATHRVLSGRQIQRWFFPVLAGGSTAGALRRAQRSCHRLVEHGVLDRLDRTVGGVRAGSSGFCYVLGSAGQRLLLPERRARRTNTLGAAYVDHALHAAEVEVGLLEALRRSEIDGLEVQAEPDCWRTFLGSGAQTVTLKPDVFAAVRTGETERRWFIEIDRATVSLVRVETKCRLYLDYLRSGEEQRRHGVFPKVLWSVPHQRRLNQLRSVVSGLPPPANRLFEICLDDHVTNHLKGGAT